MVPSTRTTCPRHKEHEYNWLHKHAVFYANASLVAFGIESADDESSYRQVCNQEWKKPGPKIDARAKRTVRISILFSDQYKYALDTRWLS
jgi:hypothetical protein